MMKIVNFIVVGNHYYYGNDAIVAQPSNDLFVFVLQVYRILWRHFKEEKNRLLITTLNRGRTALLFHIFIPSTFY